MEFCPKCGARLIHDFTDKKPLHCSKCRYVSKTSKTKKIQNKIEKEPSVVVIDKKMLEMKTFPTIEVECPKCKGKIAEVWSMTMGSNEKSDATFYRCTSCRHTRRESD
jgi:DNA-directed RNA polymerase subunit M